MKHVSLRLLRYCLPLLSVVCALSFAAERVDNLADFEVRPEKYTGRDIELNLTFVSFTPPSDARFSYLVRLRPVSLAVTASPALYDTIRFFYPGKAYIAEGRLEKRGDTYTFRIAKITPARGTPATKVREPESLTTAGGAVVIRDMALFTLLKDKYTGKRLQINLYFEDYSPITDAVFYYYADGVRHDLFVTLTAEVREKVRYYVPRHLYKAEGMLSYRGGQYVFAIDEIAPGPGASEGEAYPLATEKTKDGYIKIRDLGKFHRVVDKYTGKKVTLNLLYYEEARGGKVRLSYDVAGSEKYIPARYPDTLSSTFVNLSFSKVYAFSGVIAPDGESYYLRIDAVDTPTGMLVVTTDPPDAKVYIDRRYRGKTPFNEEVARGLYSVRVLKEGYESINAEATVRAGEKTTLAYTLSLVEENPLAITFYDKGVADVNVFDYLLGEWGTYVSGAVKAESLSLTGLFRHDPLAVRTELITLARYELVPRTNIVPKGIASNEFTPTSDWVRVRITTNLITTVLYTNIIYDDEPTELSIPELDTNYVFYTLPSRVTVTRVTNTVLYTGFETNIFFISRPTNVGVKDVTTNMYVPKEMPAMVRLAATRVHITASNVKPSSLYSNIPASNVPYGVATYIETNVDTHAVYLNAVVDELEGIVTNRSLAIRRSEEAYKDAMIDKKYHDLTMWLPEVALDYDGGFYANGYSNYSESSSGETRRTLFGGGHSHGLSLSASWNIGKSKVDLAHADTLRGIRIDMLELQTRQTLTSELYSATKAYIAALNAKTHFIVTKLNEDTEKTNYFRQLVLFNAGYISEYDLKQAELSYYSSLYQTESAKIRYEGALRNLRLTLHLDDEVDVAYIKVSYLSNIAYADEDEEFMTMVEAGSYARKLKEKEILLSEKEREKAEIDRFLPSSFSLNTYLDYGPDMSAYTGTAAGTTSDPDSLSISRFDYDVGVSFSVTYSLSSIFARNKEIEKKTLEIERARFELDRMVKDTRNKLRDLIDEHNKKIYLLTLSKRKLDIAGERYGLMKKAYESEHRLKSYDDVLQAKATYWSSISSHINLIYEIIQIRVDIGNIFENPWRFIGEGQTY